MQLGDKVCHQTFQDFEAWNPGSLLQCPPLLCLQNAMTAMKVIRFLKIQGQGVTAKKMASNVPMEPGVGGSRPPQLRRSFAA